MSFLRLTCASIVCLCTCAAASHAAQFTMTADIWNGTSSGSSYAGTDPLLGYSPDGGSDAFDNYGFYPFGIDSLSLQRRAEAFTSLNLIRWLDVFTNNTASPISTSVSFFGDVGSDLNTVLHWASTSYFVSSDGPTSDPVIAHVRGNNDWITANVTGGFTSNDQYRANFEINLLAGESIGILNFAFLARDGGAPLQSDVDLALARGQQLLDAPYLDGLTPAEIASIANFTVPEPTSLALLGLGALALLGRRRA